MKTRYKILLVMSVICVLAFVVCAYAFVLLNFAPFLLGMPVFAYLAIECYILAVDIKELLRQEGMGC